MGVVGEELLPGGAFCSLWKALGENSSLTTAPSLPSSPSKGSLVAEPIGKLESGSSPASSGISLHGQSLSLGSWTEEKLTVSAQSVMEDRRNIKELPETSLEAPVAPGIFQGLLID